MYHELTYEHIRQNRRKRLVRAIIVVAIAIVVCIAVLAAQAGAREQAALSVRQSVMDAAKQCCAVEGSYPSSLAHLEEHYGLTVNHNDYVISYEWLGDNIIPSVVVTAR